MFIGAAVMMAVTVGSEFDDAMSSPEYSLPMDTEVFLEAGSWVVFERTGTSWQNGPITLTEQRGPALEVAQIHVTDSTGSSLVTFATDGVQTVTRDDKIYTGVAGFNVPVAGSFRVRISDQGGGEVLVAQDVRAWFAPARGWLGLLGAGLLLAGIGAGVALSGRARTVRSPGVAAPWRLPGAAPPGWYPDRTQPGRVAWWDGTQWQPPGPDRASETRRGRPSVR